ncbi:unnamed protein product, partial [Effrenium voratum]
APATFDRSASFARQVITQKEVQQLLTVTDAADGSWDTIHADEQIHAQRHRDRSLFGGCVFVRLSGHIANADAVQVAHCHMNFMDRAGWDKQMDGFRILHHAAGNDLLYSVIHAPPLADRDFLMFHTVFRHESGRGLMLYSRSADDTFCPPTRKNIRAMQHLAAHQIMQDPDGGGVRFTITTAVDPLIPFLPRWIMSLMVPGEFRRWVNAVEQRCRELQKEQLALPSAALFVALEQLTAPVCRLFGASQLEAEIKPRAVTFSESTDDPGDSDGVLAQASASPLGSDESSPKVEEVVVSPG